MHFQYAHIVSCAFGPTFGVDMGNVVVVDDDAGDNDDDGDGDGDDAGDIEDDDDKEDAGSAYRRR